MMKGVGAVKGFLLLVIISLTLNHVDADIGIEVVEVPSEVVSSYQQVDRFCQDMPDGFYPDYYQACRMFYACSGGANVATFWCTKGYVFSLASGHCEPPDRALCPDPKMVTIPMNSDLVARDCARGDGVYPEFADECSSFYICKGGVKTTFRCPQDTKFDWKTKSCRASPVNTCYKLTCEDKEDGLYIDSSSFCRRYFECSNRTISEYVCPDGTVYSARHRRCTRSSTTRCPGSETAQCVGIPDGYYPDFSADCKVFGLCMNGGLKTYTCPENTFFNSKALTCDASAECSKPNVNICDGQHNGIHPVLETGCRDFYLCLDGVLTHKGSCPQGKILNPESGNCELSSLVSCLTVMDPDCDRFPDGVYPDYDTGCSAYYACLGGRRVATTYCPNGQLYDVATRKCLPSSFVLCRRQQFISPPRLIDSYNCDNRLGLYPEFSSDCKRYISCAYGHKNYFNCSEGFFFDPVTNTCKKENRNCKAPYVVASFQCLPGDDGVYVDGNCTKWHECRNGVGFTNVCPKKMLYNIKSGKCVQNGSFCPFDYKIRRRAVGGGSVLPTELKYLSFDCTSKADGVYLDHLSCRVFHMCVQQKGFSYSCPSNHTFDKETHMCALASGSEKCSVSRARSVDFKQHFSCDQLQDGMYADFESDCRRYFVCERGSSIPVYCPSGQKFNTLKMVCEKEDRVRCLPSTNYADDRNPTKPPRNFDDSYHVYGPEELFTETYANVPKRRVLTRDYGTRRRSNDEDYYDDFVDDKILESTDNHQIADSQSVPNSINNEPAKKAKPYVTSPPSSISRHSPSTTHKDDYPLKNANPPKEKALKPVKISNTDLDLACRKGDTGFFPDFESGCKMFHICFRAIRKTYSCPSVLLFNPETKNCDLPENVVCSRPEPLVADSFDCGDRVNQFAPDYQSGCRNYIGCINGLPYRFACPKGKIFSQTTAICESEVTHQCEFEADSNSTEFFTSEEQLPEALPIFRHVHGIPGHFHFSCVDKPDGFYPDYTRHCHVFYRCNRGKKFSHYCKQGLLFNPASGICDFEENVDCKRNNDDATTVAN